MKRSKPMRRSRMKRKTARRIVRETAGDKAWKRWIHLMPCLVENGSCDGPIEQAHERKMTGLGLKAPNRRSIPLCRTHHREYDEHRGMFLGMSKEERRTWMDRAIDATNDQFERMDGVPW